MDPCPLCLLLRLFLIMKTEAAEFRANAFLKIMSPRAASILITLVVFLIWVYHHMVERDINHEKPFIKYPPLKKTTYQATCGRRVEHNPTIPQRVDNLKTFLVGSYVEHRLQVRTTRTIAIVHRSARPDYRCFLCCDGTNFSVAATSSVHADHFGFDYGTADITCQVPEVCRTPIHMSISSGSPRTEAPRDVQVLQAVRNQQTRDVFPYEFTVCISVMYDFDKVLELVQVMEMFRILGVQRVAIYKTSCNAGVQEVLDYYVKQNLVEIIPWTISSHIQVSRGWKKSASPGELHYFGQIAALNDCVYRYMYQSRYVALQDLDELILPMKVKNWTQLLPELERRHGRDVGFEFENNYFLLSVKDADPDYTPESWKKVEGVNFLSHVKKLKIDHTQFNNFKVIVNPRLVYSTTVHGLLQSSGGTVRVDSDIAHMYHFRNFTFKDLESSLIQDTRLRDYADRLMPAVSKALKDIELTSGVSGRV